MSDEKKINSEIEILRAVAIAFTLFQHLEMLLYDTDGWYHSVRKVFSFWSGVDLFFCVSGFVIMRSLRMTSMTGASRFENFRLFGLPFWLRRSWRLWPAAWLWVLVSILLSVYLNKSGVFGTPEAMMGDGLAAVLHYANWHWMGCYSDALAGCNLAAGPTHHPAKPFGWVLAGYWSLSLEEQFYFVLPLLLLTGKPRILAILAMVAILVQFGVVRTPLGPLWFFRLDALLIGVLIACLAQHPRWTTASSTLSKFRAAGPIVLLSILVAIAWLSGERAVQLRFSTGMIAALSGVLVWLASYDLNLLWPSRRMKPLLLWLGSRSYSIYLAHLPVYALTWEIWMRFSPSTSPSAGGITASALVLVVILSELSFRIIERPLRNYGRHFVESRFAAQRLTAKL